MKIYKLRAQIGTSYKGDPENELDITIYEVVEKPKSYVGVKGGMRVNKDRIGHITCSGYDHAIYADTYATDNNLEELKQSIIVTVNHRLQKKIEDVEKLKKASKTELVIKERG
jgi:hypothetical protein